MTIPITHTTEAAPVSARKTWKELEASGVQRCCAMFVGGGRCKRRAVANHFCAKHGPIIEKATSEHMDAIKGQSSMDDQDPEGASL